jgi:hypothetical protein
VNKEIFDKLCITVLSFTFVVGLLILAIIYDGTWMWIFLFVGGSLTGIPIGTILHKYPFTRTVKPDNDKDKDCK